MVPSLPQMLPRGTLPVSRYSALTVAGEIAGTGGSPQPDGFSELTTMWTSAVTGVSLIHGGV
jgi:hypothetical protein